MMSEIPVQLLGEKGELLGRLRQGARNIIAEAEQTARSRNLTKRNALSTVLSEHLKQAGVVVNDMELNNATNALDAIRRGESLAGIQVSVSKSNNVHSKKQLNHNRIEELVSPMNMASNSKVGQVPSFFEVERTYPDENAHNWYQRLIGLEEHKRRLIVELEMLLYPERVEEWSRKHHNKRILRLCELQRNRVPLILLEGDVGTGKTALAETIGDALARQVKKKVHLLKINSQVRGTGLVGEMSDLISQAFSQAELRAKSLNGEPILLLIDEADTLATSRDTQQMHHEDKAGINTVLQRLDNLRLVHLPLAVILITNRPDALDPAIRRRAALRLSFSRPDDSLRTEIIRTSIPELAFEDKQVVELVNLTGEKASKNKGIVFTASDITDRLFAGALREAFSQNRALRFEDLLEQATKLEPTPQMGTS